MTEVAAVLTSATSALATTAVVAVSLLLAGVGSVVAEPTVALLLIVAPSAVLALTVALMTIVWPAPAARLVKLVLPVQAAEVPPSTVKVGLASSVGRLSVTLTDWASEGPPLWTVRV